MNTDIEIPTKNIAEFCRRWKITEFSLFGSVLRDDFQPESDIDVLVHEYFRINLLAVWDTIKKDIPELIEKNEPLLPDNDDY